MRKKSKTVGGNNCYMITIKMPVSRGVFATALADHFVCSGDWVTEKLTRSRAFEILKNRLFFYGLNGEYEEVPENIIEEHNELYRQAEIWITKNYPYLGEN